jgi:hypothetical protein
MVFNATFQPYEQTGEYTLSLFACISNLPVELSLPPTRRAYDCTPILIDELTITNQNRKEPNNHTLLLDDSFYNFILSWALCFFNNISVISWQSVLLVEETGVPGENYRPASSH